VRIEAATTVGDLGRATRYRNRLAALRGGPVVTAPATAKENAI